MDLMLKKSFRLQSLTLIPSINDEDVRRNNIPYKRKILAKYK